MMKLTTNNYRTKHAGWVHTLHAKSPKSKMTQPTLRRVAFGRRINYSEYVFLCVCVFFFFFPPPPSSSSRSSSLSATSHSD